MFGDFVNCQLKDYLLVQGGIGRFSVDMHEAPVDYPGSRDLIGYWESKRSADGWVPREAIKPHEIPRLLPNVFILDPQDGDWSLRLLGTGIVERTGYELTGKTLRQIYEPPVAESLVALYRRVAATGEKATLKGRLLGFGIEHAWSESLALPVRARDGATVQILGAIFFYDQIIAA